MGANPNSLIDMHFRTVFAFIALLFVSAMLAGCILPGQPSIPKSLVPASATSVLLLNPSQILSDPDFRELYRVAFPGKTIDDEFAPIRTISGIDPRNAEAIAIFTLGEGGKQNTAMIIKGPIDRGTVERALSSNPTWTLENYNSKTLFRNSGPDGPLSAAFAGGDLVLGGEPAVKAVLDVESGSPSLSQNLRLSQVLAKLPEDSAVSFAKEITQDERGSLFAGTPLNASDAFSTAQASGLSVQKQSTSVNLRGVILFGSGTEALRAKASADIALALLRAFSASGSSTESLLSKIQTSTQGELTMIDLRGTSLSELSSAKSEIDSQSAEQP